MDMDVTAPTHLLEEGGCRLGIDATLTVAGRLQPRSLPTNCYYISKVLCVNCEIINWFAFELPIWRGGRWFSQ